MRKGFGVTANRLGDGAVVWLTTAREWSTRASDAAFYASAAESDPMVAWGKTQERIVCGVYAFELAIEDDGTWRTNVRERLRAAGAPAVRARLGVGESA